jgi:hypothetical protein
MLAYASESIHPVTASPIYPDAGQAVYRSGGEKKKKYIQHMQLGTADRVT